MRVFPLRTGQISQFPFRRLPWNNNVALNGFVIYSNSCLFLFGILSPTPQMSQPNVRMPQRSEYKQMLANLFKCNEMDVNEAWMNICWNQFAGKGLISELVRQWCRQSFDFCLFFKKKNLRTWGWSHDGRGKTIDAGTSPRVGHRWEAGHLLWEEILLFFWGKYSFRVRLLGGAIAGRHVAIWCGRNYFVVWF